jgi:hypothetical protein
MEINKDAPGVAHGEIEVDASPEIVWEVFTDINVWPSWNPDVKSAVLQGPLHAGTQFEWKAGPGTIRSTIQEVEQSRRIAWTGKTFGITAVHVYEFEPQGGGTIVESDESWDGLLVRLLRGRMTKTLQKSTDSGLRHLKAEAERRGSGETSAP